MGGFHVGSNPQQADAHGDAAQQYPADKAQVKQKQFPLVALHQLLAALQAVVLRHFGVVVHQVGRQCIRICLDNAGDNQQQRPQEGQNYHQQRGTQHAPAIYKDTERLVHQIVDYNHVADEMHKVEAETECQRTNHQQTGQWYRTRH